MGREGGVGGEGGGQGLGLPRGAAVGAQAGQAPTVVLVPHRELPAGAGVDYQVKPLAQLVFRYLCLSIILEKMGHDGLQRFG